MGLLLPVDEGVNWREIIRDVGAVPIDTMAARQGERGASSDRDLDPIAFRVEDKGLVVAVSGSARAIEDRIALGFETGR